MKLLIIFLLSFISLPVFSQSDSIPSLSLGDPAPQIRVSSWLKGTPVEKFEKGKIYVVEFWATWCKPCIASMPHLSELAEEYKDKVTIIGVDIHEQKTTTLQKVKSFVDKMGPCMSYNVATEDDNFMSTSYLDASGGSGIPVAFVIDKEGNVVWIGHPHNLGDILKQVVDNSWDIKSEIAKRNFVKYIQPLDEQAGLELKKFVGNPYKQDDLGRPDSGLALINAYLKKEPGLKYSSSILFYNLSFLLLTDPHKAYEYGEEALKNSGYFKIPYHLIWSIVQWYSQRVSLPPEIYQLGIDAYQARINAFPEIVSPSFYIQMAEWYSILNEKEKAINAQRKAIDLFQVATIFSAPKMALMKDCLKQYKKM